MVHGVLSDINASLPNLSVIWQLRTLLVHLRVSLVCSTLPLSEIHYRNNRSLTQRAARPRTAPPAARPPSASRPACPRLALTTVILGSTCGSVLKSPHLSLDPSTHGSWCIVGYKCVIAQPFCDLAITYIASPFQRTRRICQLDLSSTFVPLLTITTLAGQFSLLHTSFIRDTLPQQSFLNAASGAASNRSWTRLPTHRAPADLR